MKFRVFYCFYATDDYVPAESAISMSVDDVISELLPRVESDGDFVGLVDSAGTAFQIMNEDDAPRSPAKRFRLDIPAPDEGGSYSREVHWAGVEEIVRALPAVLDPAAVPGLTFRAW